MPYALSLSTFVQPIADAYPFGNATTETRRLKAVARVTASDEALESAFDPLAALAARVFDTPMALVTLVESYRIRLIGRYGFGSLHELPNESGLCASAVQQHVPYFVERADLDVRTRSHSLVSGNENVRFYVGIPLRTSDGHNVGVLAVLDRIARHPEAHAVSLLTTLASLAVDRLERFTAS